MNKKQIGRWMSAALLLALGGTMGWAGDLAITSFDGTGRLSFNRVTTAETYRVEWAPTPSGPWTNFTGAAGAALDNIAQFATGSYTCSVPMCYRVVASVTNAAPPQVEEDDYLVVDLSGGSGASSYPVTYLEAVPGGGWTDEHKTTKLVMRLIPKGTFIMGSPSGELGRKDYDETQHQVTLTQDFYIGVFEITQRQWELVMGNKPSYFNNATHYQTRPVEEVSYYDIRENPANIDDPAVNWPANSAVNATSFMGKLRSKTGLSGFDLPTESQWEYACRAGTTTALNSGYNLTSTGNDPRMAAVGRYSYNHPGGYSGSSSVSTDGGTAKVGSYTANAWGLYDMHGNVSEWCLDWDGTYPGTVTDPAGASSGSRRVVRGGSWLSSADNCRSAYRYYYSPGTRFSHYGFRACCAPPGQP